MGAAKQRAGQFLNHEKALGEGDSTSPTLSRCAIIVLHAARRPRKTCCDRASARRRGPFRAYSRGSGVRCLAPIRTPNTQHREQSDMSLRWAWPLLNESTEFERGAAALKQAPAALWVEGLAGTAKWFVAAAMAERLGAPLLLITASEE